MWFFLPFKQETHENEILPRQVKIGDLRRSLSEVRDFDRARLLSILERWDSVEHQIDQRLLGLEKAEKKLLQFRVGLQNELDWLKVAEEKVAKQQWNTENQNAEKVMEELTVR